MISYIIPVYNGSASIEKCIQHILDQSGDFDREVFVINDGSTDNTAEIVKKQPVNLVNRPHLGASSTRNYGVKCTNGDYIVMVDADTFLDSDWTEICLQEDPKTYEILQTSDLKNHVQEPHIINLRNKIRRQCYVTSTNLIGFIGNGSFFPASNRHLIKYDEMYIVGGEDIDLMFNLIEKKVKIKVITEAGFIHKHMHRSAQVKYLSFIKKKIVFAYGNVRTYFKHPNYEYTKRDAWNNKWVLPFYPFLWIYKKIRNLF